MRHGHWMLLAPLLVSLACASSPGASAAARGDRAALLSYVSPLHQKGKIDNAEAAEIAKASLAHELLSAKGDDAIERVRDARPCARDVESALLDRMATHDAAGAAAASALLESGYLSPDRAREWVKDADASWRALGVRGLVRQEDADARRAALLDGSPDVRRAAMRASAVANDPHDLAGLFEAARLDPELIARSEAVRAIARIDTSDPEVANRLRDLWARADDGLREDIASAYAAPSIAAHGGAEALRVLVASGHGPGVISAASAILRATMGIKRAPYDEQTRASAIALLARTIETGSLRDRSFALAVAPVSEPSLFEAIKRAADDTSDADARVSALTRLLDVPAEKTKATAELESYAQPEAPAGLARRARAALARAGDLKVQAWIEKDLASEDASVRLSAADALASLGRAARGAPLLADGDARVRTRAACTILMASRRP